MSTLEKADPGVEAAIVEFDVTPGAFRPYGRPKIEFGEGRIGQVVVSRASISSLAPT